MEKSHFALLLLYSFSQNIYFGFALRCYGCNDGIIFLEVNTTLASQYIAKDAPKCSDGMGKEFDCSGSCAKSSIPGGSEFF